MFEGDALALQPRLAEAAAGGIDHLRAVVRGELLQGHAGQHIAAVHALVFEDAIVEQIHRAAMMSAEQRRLGGDTLLWQRLARLGEIDMPREVGEAHLGLVDPPVLVEQLRAQPHIAEAAAEAGHRVAFGIGVTLRHALHALAGNALRDLRLHFHEEEAASTVVFRVLLKDRVCRGTASSKRIQNDRVWWRAVINYALNHGNWLWEREKSFVEDRIEIVRARL